MVTAKHVIPYIASIYPINSNTVIAEIGCGEAGNLQPFLEMGCKVTGIDISEVRIERAKKYFASHPLKDNITLIANDVFVVNYAQIGTFDLIMVRDTLEHIKNSDLFLSHLKTFLKSDGRIFVGFPPWRMPFGGHQQMCENGFLSRTPYLHLLPKPLFIGILKLFGEKQYRIEELLDVRETRMTINNFKKIIANNCLKIEKADFYLINPSYEIKFNLKAKKLPRVLNIPHLRDSFTTACYYILS